MLKFCSAASVSRKQPRLIELKDTDELHGGAIELVEEEMAYVRRRPGRPGGQNKKMLTGLAVSGGGIRSASFALGILQAFAEKQRLHWFDYLSTVSGGGYIGSALTWMLHKRWKKPADWPNWDPGACTKNGEDGDREDGDGELQFSCKPPCFPYTSTAGRFSRGTLGRVHTALLRHMRQNGNYLIPGKGLNIGSLAAVILRGSLVSLFVYLPLLILAMLVVTLYAVSEAPRIANGWMSFLPALSVVAATGVAALVIAASAWYRRRVMAAWDPPPTWKALKKELWPSVYRPTLLATAAGAFSMLLLKLAEVEEFIHLFKLAGGLALIGALLSLLYAANSHCSRSLGTKWYIRRLYFEKGMGALLGAIALVLLFASLPLVDEQLTCYLEGISGAEGNTGTLGALMAALGAAFSGSSYFATARAKAGKLPLGVQVWLGAGLLIYGLMLFAYDVAIPVYENITGVYLLIMGDAAQDLALPLSWAAIKGGEGAWPLALFSLWLLLALLLARYTNVNYMSVHRYYRDRLMETFMPTPTRVLEGGKRRSMQANEARLSDMCDWRWDKGVFGPYHLINTNVLLVKSKVPKFRARGGDNFILSPLFCGSHATRWMPTEQFMGNNMSLATAMAISGAAANPNAGVGGEGVTRNPALSFLMSLLNIRLGFWAPNPSFKGVGGIPDMLQPGLGELLRYGLDETGRYVQLSDGGHFENLAVYELVRRQLDLIVCSDAGADEAFSFGDLGNMVEKIRVDFGARIDFDQPLADLVPDKASGRGAKRGYITGIIVYRGGKRGRFVFIKSTWLEGLSADLAAYRKQHPSFPDQSTADQFFSERQFEAYRELGFAATWQMLKSLEQEGIDIWKPIDAPLRTTNKKAVTKKAAPK